MDEIDPVLLLRIDAFLGLFALTLVVACFALVAVNLVVGLVSLFVTVATVLGAIQGYRRGYGFESEDSGGAVR